MSKCYQHLNLERVFRKEHVKKLKLVSFAFSLLAIFIAIGDTKMLDYDTRH